MSFAIVCESRSPLMTTTVATTVQDPKGSAQTIGTGACCHVDAAGYTMTVEAGLTLADSPAHLIYGWLNKDWQLAPSRVK